MFYVAFILLLFAAAVGAHTLFCRFTSVPGLHTKTFGHIALACLAVYAAVAYWINQQALLDPQSLWGLPFVMTGGFIFILLAPCYLTFYVLTQLMSPSKKILLALQRAQSLDYEGVLASVREEDFIGTRLAELRVSGCIVKTADGYALSPSGRTIAMFLNCMQAMLGRKAGG